MMFEYTSFTRRAPALGKCPDCYGEGTQRHVLDRCSLCPLCGGSGWVAAGVLAEREAKYRAWLKRRVAKKPRRK